MGSLDSNAVNVVGSGAISASGINKKIIYENCIKGNSSVDTNTGLAKIAESNWQELIGSKGKFIGQSRCSILSYHALSQTIEDAHWTDKELSECGFIFATTTSMIDQWQNSLPYYKSKNISFSDLTLAARQQSLGYPMLELKEQFKIIGPSTVVASSCSASLQAIALASIWIKQKKVKRCIVGSTEILAELTVEGFNSLRLLSKNICQPFGLNRSGINLGEASGFLCLECSDLEHDNILSVISGVGLSTDAYHATAPDPSGGGSIVAVKKALNMAQLEPKNIDWFYAHGTGSNANDTSEANAINTLFEPNSIPVSSTKSIHGHTLGACGALESIIAVEAFQNQNIPGTLMTPIIDDKLKLNVLNKSVHNNIEHILKNSLGFGGINASIVFSKQGRK